MEGVEEKLCLKWNEFQENTVSAFEKLREYQEFSDVTLAYEDGQNVKVHKVIMASSSPFFLNLLKMNRHPHPLIYMRGLKSEDLLAIVDFLYFGEARVGQDNLESFLSAAEEFQVKGLVGANIKKDSLDVEDKCLPKQRVRKEIKSEALNPVMFKIRDKEGNKGSTDFIKSTDLQDLDGTIKSMIEISDKLIDTKHGRVRICKVCGKEGELGNIKIHVESAHITGVLHTCNICGKTVRSRNALWRHNSKHHRT